MKLDELLDLLRREKVARFEANDELIGGEGQMLRVVFHESAFAPVVLPESERSQTPAETEDKPDAAAYEKAEVGSDGLTARQQFETYGRVVDAPLPRGA